VSDETGARRPAPGASGPRRLWRLLAGEPGPGPALALAVIALLGAFVAMGGPRELTAVQNNALRQTLASAGAFGISASDDWQIVAGGQPLSADQIQVMAGVMGGYLHPPLVSPATTRWSGMTAPLLPWPGAPPRAILGEPPVIETAYRAGLTSNARLVSGSFPQVATPARMDGRSVIILQAAVTAATATRLGLRIGSLVSLGGISSLLPGDPGAVLKVTGILRPTDPGSSFWTQDPSVAAPTVLTIGSGLAATTAWACGVFVGPNELTAVQDVYSGAILDLNWQFPLVTSGLTAAQAPQMLAAMNSLANGNAGQAALQASGPPLLSPPTLAAAGAGTLSGFITSQAAVASTDSLLLVGIVAATVILLLVGAVVITDAYAAELALARARGGSTRQLALRILGTAAGVAGPALVVGTVAAIAATPGGGNTVSWILVALVAVATLAGPSLLAAWRMRGLRALTTPGRGDLVIGRRSPRRLIAEITALIVVAGAVLALRLRGLAPGAGFDPYLSSAPVLVAAAAGLIAIRVYPVPLRLLLRFTAAGRGTVGYLGMARSARTRSVPMLPALALVVALTVIALGGLIRAAVSHGQSAASWQQVGADALVEGGGSNPSVSPAARRAMAGVPGVRLACAAYVISPGSALAANQLLGAGGVSGIGLVIADPAQYAALVADTPWPAFPATLLAPPRAGSPRDAPVPVIASPAVAAAMRSGTGQIGFAGSELTIRVAATVSSTPALPGGGLFVIIPSWVASRLAGSVAPNTVLIAGPATNIRDLRAVAARTAPGSLVVSRAAVLQATADTPLVHASDLMFEESAGAAAACAVAAVLLGLLLSGRDRTRLAAWLTAMGMTARQGRRLAVLDALPLLLVAILGAEIAGLALGPLIGPGLVLSAFTSSTAPVPLQPDVVALIAPAVGAVILITVAAIGQSALARRRSTGASGVTGVLRLDEGRQGG
jgi:putative ABC transport system permease protein